MAGRPDGGTARSSKKKESLPPMSKTTLRIPKDLHKQLKIRSVEEERDMQELATEALQQYLAKPKRTARSGERT